jgi:hypothetical protein
VVTLSSSEEECVAILEALKGIRLIFYLLRDMGTPVKLPIMVRDDNIGVMFMAENASSGLRARHIDTKYHFIMEHCEEVLIKIVLVKTDENDPDLFIKNANKDTYETHVMKFLG